MGEELTHSELTELAEAGDREALELLAESGELWAAEALVEAEFQAAAAAEALRAADTSAVPLADEVEADGAEDELVDPASVPDVEPAADEEKVLYHPKRGDTVVVHGGSTSLGVVRVAHGRGAVTLEDGRQLRREQYAKALF